MLAVDRGSAGRLGAAAKKRAFDAGLHRRTPVASTAREAWQAWTKAVRDGEPRDVIEAHRAVFAAVLDTYR